MAPSTLTELIIALLFVVPGFVTRTVISASIRRNKQEPQEWVVEVLLYGVVNFAIFLIVYAIALASHLISADEFTAFPSHPIADLIVALTGVVFLVITPTFLGAFFLWLLNYVKLLRNLLKVRLIDVPTAWDAFFERHQQCWVVVTFKDGSRAGGFMGLNSAAASSEDGQDIYLERSYNVTPDGALSAEPTPGSGGIWVRGSEIKSLEFYLPPSVVDALDP